MYAGSKIPYSYSALKQALKNNDLVLFKITKKRFLDNIPNKWTPKRHRFDVLTALAAQIEKDLINHDYHEKTIDNRSGTWVDDDPLWQISKLHYFFHTQVNEYYSPITISPNHSMLDIHPGFFRMAMLDYQRDNCLLTFLLDANKCLESTPSLFDTYCTLTKMHFFHNTPQEKWEKLMNIDKLGKVTITYTQPGINFVTNRAMQPEYKKVWNLSYHKNEKLFTINRQPFVKFDKNEKDWKFLLTR